MTTFIQEGEVRRIDCNFPEVGKYYEYVKSNERNMNPLPLVYLGKLISRTTNGNSGEGFILTLHFQDAYNNDIYIKYGPNNPLFYYKEVDEQERPTLEELAREIVKREFDLQTVNEDDPRLPIITGEYKNCKGKSGGKSKRKRKRKPKSRKRKTRSK